MHAPNGIVIKPMQKDIIENWSTHFAAYIRPWGICICVSKNQVPINSHTTNTMIAKDACIIMLVEKVFLKAPLSPRPISNVMKRLDADVKDADITENIPTNPPTTLDMP